MLTCSLERGAGGARESREVQRKWWGFQAHRSHRGAQRGIHDKTVNSAIVVTPKTSPHNVASDSDSSLLLF